MKNVLIIFLLVSCFSYKAECQSNEQVILEHTSENLYTFYFDSQYFLVDKNCEFFSIKRQSNYNTFLKTFEGPFTDYDIDGNIILTGSYKDGKRDGTFKAFYPAGFLKWQAEFSEGRAMGSWFFYYQDGSPMSILKIDGYRIYVTNTWNGKGKPVIKNGKGKFELIEPQFGFNEQGYESIIYSGTIENGLPQGSWRIFYGYPKGENEIAAIEKFDNGNFVGGTLMDNYRTYKESKIQFAPSTPYRNAERLIVKNCTIDDFYNYSLYLSDYLTGKFDLALLKGLPDKTIEFTLNVDKKGAGSNISLTKAFEDDTADKVLLYIIRSVPYWIPSQKDGAVIRDQLTVETDFTTDSDGKTFFTNVKIRRSTGN